MTDGDAAAVKDEPITWPFTFELSRATVPFGSTALVGREPTAGEALDAGVLDDDRAENMAALMSAALSCPPSEVRSLGLPDYMAISRRFHRFLAQIGMEQEGDITWPHSVVLTTPARGKDKVEVARLNLREPTAGDCIKAGLLDGGAGAGGLAQLLTDVANVDMAVVRSMSLTDFSRITAVFASFLSGATKAAKAIQNPA